MSRKPTTLIGSRSSTSVRHSSKSAVTCLFGCWEGMITSTGTNINKNMSRLSRKLEGTARNLAKGTSESFWRGEIPCPGPMPEIPSWWKRVRSVGCRNTKQKRSICNFCMIHKSLMDWRIMYVPNVGWTARRSKSLWRTSPSENTYSVSFSFSAPRSARRAEGGLVFIAWITTNSLKKMKDRVIRKSTRTKKNRKQPLKLTLAKH